MASLPNDDIRTNAYVDGELDRYERAVFLEELVRNPTRSREVAELAELNELMRLAFESVPGAPKSPFAARATVRRPGRVQRVLRAALGTIVLAATFGGGWLACRSELLRERPPVAAAQTGLPVHGAQAPGMMLLLASPKREEVDATLLRAHQLLERYHDHGPTVEIVVTGLAVKFLKPGGSHYSKAIAKLMKRYPDLKVVACEATLQALNGNRGRILLLKRVDLVPTAVQEVVKRLEQGWVYVKA